MDILQKGFSRQRFLFVIFIVHYIWIFATCIAGFAQNITKCNLSNLFSTFRWQDFNAAIRSDPYAGMSALYYYLYCDNRTAQILLFPNISMAEWDELGRNTKTYRMFKEFGDAILFQDGLLLRDEL